MAKKTDIEKLIDNNLADKSNIKPNRHREVHKAVLDYANDETILLREENVRLKDELTTKINTMAVGIQGEAFPNSIGPKNNGMYTVQEPGIYLHFLDDKGEPISVTQEDYDTGLVYLVYNGKSCFKSVTPITNNGEVREGDMRGVNGDTVFKGLPKIKSSKINIKPNIKLSTAVNSEGKASTHPEYKDFKSAVLLMLKPNTDYVLTGLNILGVNKMFTLTDITDTERVLLGEIKSIPFYFKTTNTAYYATFSLKTRSEIDDSGWMNTSIDELGNGHGVYEIDDFPIVARELDKNNFTPYPIKDNNAVNLKALKELSLLNENLELKLSDNKAYKKYFIKDKYVGNTGKIYDKNATGWVMLLIPIEEFGIDKNLCFGNFKISTGGYYSFLDSNLEPVGNYFGSTGSVVISKTLEVPMASKFFALDVARPANSETDYMNVIVNKGTELIEYIEAVDSIIGINDMSFKSNSIVKFSDLRDVDDLIGNGGKFLIVKNDETGVTYTESVEINLTDPNFNTLSAKSASFKALSEEIQEWDENSSTDLQRGDKYLFKVGDNYLIKVKG